jgi:hypothetical protein
MSAFLFVLLPVFLDICRFNFQSSGVFELVSSLILIIGFTPEKLTFQAERLL